MKPWCQDEASIEKSHVSLGVFKVLDENVSKTIGFWRFLSCPSFVAKTLQIPRVLAHFITFTAFRRSTMSRREAYGLPKNISLPPLQGHIDTNTSPITITALRRKEDKVKKRRILGRRLPKERGKVKSSGHVTRPKAFPNDINLPPLQWHIDTSPITLTAFRRSTMSRREAYGLPKNISLPPLQGHIDTNTSPITITALRRKEDKVKKRRVLGRRPSQRKR